MILKCKEKTTPAMDTCAKWTGGLLLFAFFAFIIFSMVFLIVKNRIELHKNAYDELKSNLEEIEKYCDGRPGETSVTGGDWSPSTCTAEKDKLEKMRNGTPTANAASPVPQTNQTVPDKGPKQETNQNIDDAIFSVFQT